MAECLLAFDFGLKTIGVAVAQTVTNQARPLPAIAAEAGKPDWRVVEELVDEWQPSTLLVGLPLNMDDTESELSELARKFGDQLHTLTGLPVEMVDERLTTRAAMEITGGDLADSHGVAAALIAETYLR